MTVRPEMKGKTVLITGASQGIGKQAAIELASMGATLVLICRNRQRAEAAVEEIHRRSGNAAPIDVIFADLSIQAEVRRAAAEFKSRHSQLHVLLNNAGLILPERRVTVDGLEETFATNHVAYFLLTDLLLDVLKASAPARIVNVSSEAHRYPLDVQFDDLQFERGYGQWGAYGQSKRANLLFTYELARRLEGTGVTVNALHPGAVRSNFGHNGGVLTFLVKLSGAFMISVEKGARTSVYLASSPEVEGVSGRYFSRCRPVRSARSTYDVETQRRLWEITEQLVAKSAGAQPAADGESSRRSSGS